MSPLPHMRPNCTKLSKFSEYDESLEEMLCEWLVGGLANNGFSSASLQKIFPLARSGRYPRPWNGWHVMPCRALQQAGAHNGALVHKLRQQPRLFNQAKGGNTCYQRNGSHNPSQCCFRDTECHACGTKGHIKSA